MFLDFLLFILGTSCLIVIVAVLIHIMLEALID